VPVRLAFSRPDRPPAMSLQQCADAVERGLLASISTGDLAAFETFYRLYHPRLLRFVSRTGRVLEQAEDLIQETLLLVWENPGRFTGASKVSTWVFGIAYKKMLKALSRAARRGADVDIADMEEILGDPMGDFSARAETRDWLDRALGELSAEQRAVIDLTFSHGMSYEDIALVLDCPENTVKTRMFHARRKLQAFADAQGA
jgi:RNA polymerase sigma factor (sigma-70 family)